MEGKGVRLYPHISWLLAMGHLLGRQVPVVGGQRGWGGGLCPVKGKAVRHQQPVFTAAWDGFLAPRKNLFGTPWYQLGFLRWYRSKESACQCRRHKRCGFDPWVGKTSWRRKWQPTPVFLPEKFHRQRSLVGYSPWLGVGVGSQRIQHN